MRTRVPLLPVLGILLAPVSRGEAWALPVSFEPPATIAVGAGPRWLTVADFNGDGRPDIATADANSRSISVVLSSGASGFAPTRTLTLTYAPRGVASGDFNGDGYVDLVTMDILQQVYVLAGDGAGSFVPQPLIVVTNSPNFAAVADFNGDNRLDLALTGPTPGNIQIALGNGAGGFALGGSFGQQDARMLAVADFNRDGRTDLAAPDLTNDLVKIMLGDGTGGFSIQPIPSGGHQPVAILAADFNRDGRDDLAVLNSSPSTISVFLGNGAGSFAAPRSIDTPGATGIAAADFDGDANIDLAASANGTTGIFAGDGMGGFATPQFISGSGNAPTATDLNRDGHPDLVAANFAANTVVLMLNRTIDTDGDGILDYFDNCKTVSNTDQSDVDADGRGDVCDNCPPLPNSSQADVDDNGIGDVCDALFAILPGTEEIAALQASLSALSARVAQLEAAKSSTDAAIMQLQISDRTQGSDIEAIKRQIVELQAKVAFLMANLQPGKKPAPAP